jgi:DNA-binding LacI/PurR family transcriptional regulator
MRVPLTSIDVAGFELGERAGKLALLAIQNGSGVGPSRVLIKPKLIKRKSSQGAH